MWTGVLTFFLLSLFTSRVSVFGIKVELSVATTGYPTALYKDEPITIQCTATEYTSVNALQLIKRPGGERSGCVTSVLGGSASNDALPSTFNRLDNPTCTTILGSSPPTTLRYQGTVTDALNGHILYCLAAESADKKHEDGDFTIDTIRGYPENLETFFPEVVYEGRPFTFECNSTGAVPPSQYKYEVLRNGVVVNSTTGSLTATYTPVADDRNGITLRCTDTVHSMWRVKEDTIANSDNMKPYYINTTGVEPIRSVELNPDSAVLECNVDGYPLTYTWTCMDNLCGSSTKTSRILRLTDVQRKNGDQDTISCTASVPSLSSVTIAIEVTWSDDATTPPPVGPSDNPTTNKSTDLNWGAIGGGIAAGVVVICIVVIGVIYYKKRTKSGGSGGKNPENGETIKMRGAPQSQSGMPGKPKHQNSKKQPKSKAPAKPSQPPAQHHRPEYQDDKILYADLDHSANPPIPVTKNSAKSPPPQDRVEYTSIDMLKTQQQRQPGLQDSVGDEYTAIDKSKKQPPKQNGDTYENVSNKRNDRSSMPKGNAPTPY